nr:reverse transcriptase domain-containing protein [Tanacetum cinerariifolium]
SQTDFERYVKANDAVLRNIQSQGQSTKNQCQNIQNQHQTVRNQLANLTDMMSKFMSSNMASSSGSGTLPGNTVTNPKEDLKAHVQPPITQSETPVFEPIVASFSALMPNLKPTIPYPSRRDNERRREQANEQIEKFYEIFKDMSFEISFTDALILMPKFASTLKAFIRNKEKLSKMARTPMNEHCSVVILNKLPKKLRDLGKFLIPCEFPGMDECLALADLELADRSVSKPIGIAKDVSVKVEDDPDSSELDPSYYDPEGDIQMIEAILNSDLAPSLPDHEQSDLPPHLEYVFLKGDNKLPVIITKELGDEEKAALIKVLKSHKRAIAWKLSDIQEDYKPVVQHQRRVNLKIHDVIKKEVEKLLDVGLIYPISDSPWVSPVHCVPKKGGFTVVKNEENELIPTRLVTGWREGIVLGHKISRNGIGIDKAKVDVITKLPHPTTVKGPKTPSPSKQESKVTKDQVQTPSSQNTAPVQPLVIQFESQASISEPVVAPVSALMPNLKPSIPYPLRRNNEKRRDQANEQIEKFYEIFKEMS